MITSQQYRIIFVLLLSVAAIPAVSSTIINSQEGEVVFLDSHDVVSKLYKQVNFTTPFSEESDLLDSKIDQSNPKNPITCLTFISTIGSESISNSGISIQTYATLITNKSFYVVYDTQSSPTRLTSLTVKWTCFTAEQVYAFDFEFDASQTSELQYKALEYTFANGTILPLAKIGNITSIQSTFLISGFSTTSSQFSLDMQLTQSTKDSPITSVIKNTNSISKVSGKIIASTKDNCSAVTSHQSDAVLNYSDLTGTFSIYKSVKYASFYGIGGLTLQLQNGEQFNFDLEDYQVNYSGGKITGEIGVVNGIVKYQSMICQISDAHIQDTPVDIVIGSLTIIFGIIIYLSTTLLYLKKKKQHIILEENHPNVHHHNVYTDHDHSHTSNAMTKQI